jgi:hypothetical protein
MYPAQYRKKGSQGGKVFKMDDNLTEKEELEQLREEKSTRDFFWEGIGILFWSLVEIGIAYWVFNLAFFGIYCSNIRSMGPGAVPFTDIVLFTIAMLWLMNWMFGGSVNLAGLNQYRDRGMPAVCR